MPFPDHPILILTLEGDEARRSKLTDALDGLGLSYRLFFGVDGRKGLGAKYEAMIDRPETERRIGHVPSDAYYACALSHQLAIAQAIEEEGAHQVTILEDDAIVGDAFAHCMTNRTYEPFPMLLMDHRTGRFGRRGTAVQPGVTAFPVVMTPTLATGYTMNRETALRFLAASRPLCGIPDWPCDLAPLGAWAAYPRMVDHPPFDLTHSHLEASRRGQTSTARRKPLGEKLALEFTRARTRKLYDVSDG